MATPALLTLLEVQSCDTAADQLAHRRATLPARAALAALTASSATLDQQLDALGPGVHALERSQKRLEDEVATTEDKAAATERQLYSGTVTAPRELQAMQDELASLRRRIGALEDELLEVMEQREPLDADAARLRVERDDVERWMVVHRGSLRVVVNLAEEVQEIDLDVIPTQVLFSTGELPALDERTVTLGAESAVVLGTR